MQSLTLARTVQSEWKKSSCRRSSRWQCGLQLGSAARARVFDLVERGILHKQLEERFERRGALASQWSAEVHLLIFHQSVLRFSCNSCSFLIPLSFSFSSVRFDLYASFDARSKFVFYGGRVLLANASIDGGTGILTFFFFFSNANSFIDQFPRKIARNNLSSLTEVRITALCKFMQIITQRDNAPLSINHLSIDIKDLYSTHSIGSAGRHRQW